MHASWIEGVAGLSWCPKGGSGELREPPAVTDKPNASSSEKCIAYGSLIKLHKNSFGKPLDFLLRLTRDKTFDAIVQ